MAHTDPRTAFVHRWALLPLVLLLLAGLPLAVWLDLKNLSERTLRLQAGDINSIVTSVRSYYAANVVARVLATSGHSPVVHNYQSIPGAIPTPPTLSIELARIIGEQQSEMSVRFVSDYPFPERTSREFDDFEKAAIKSLRQNPKQTISEVTWSGLTGRVRLVSPVIMDAATCVGCHNTHPDSPKRDWQLGDVRGIQEVIIATSMASNIFSFKYLLGYFAFMAVLGFGFIVVQRRLIRTIEGMNRKLESTNDVLANVARKISRYLAPQVYSSIFSGKTEVAIQTERKKLTVFFSDIEDFTGATERLQPEEITSLLNEYLTEMSNIAAKYGGTLNKFIGDAIVIFFGDPETKGAAEDAKACLAMAVHMQRRMAELNAQWRRRGIERPFRVRMGINTGYCNVGNFGSEDRMDYTIIGAEANLAQRLQSVAEPGHIVLSYETYTLVREMVSAHALPSIAVKGINRQIVPYLVDGLLDATGTKIEKFSEHTTGLDFYLDLGVVDDAAEGRIRGLLQDAIAALDRRKGPAKLV
ncbi:MAG: adenylate/guanylate cyclase domain-containing protein [Rhodospirillales bacterium]|nr:adenylate/guanylate cyclase domain-containing protein [Rhodospirillales bacterium]